ncbi:hypothetical protein PAHAL_1G296500 [Panicum hallii]|uniref:Uncharacterized protein n=1 Tax=Panicum hallii TaxID=206008 RepID=A0A2T8KWR4_9POAL|nr:hypothetical protein PAHAL_1G296500 [Panicum hallii]
MSGHPTHIPIQFKTVQKSTQPTVAVSLAKNFITTHGSVNILFARQLLSQRKKKQNVAHFSMIQSFTICLARELRREQCDSVPAFQRGPIVLYHLAI